MGYSPLGPGALPQRRVVWIQEGTDDQTSLWLTKLQAWCCLDLAQVEPSGPGSWTSELTESDEGAHLQGPTAAAAAAAESLQSCLTLCDPMDCSPPGSSVHGII